MSSVVLPIAFSTINYFVLFILRLFSVITDIMKQKGKLYYAELHSTCTYTTVLHMGGGSISQIISLTGICGIVNGVYHYSRDLLALDAHRG